MRIPPRDDRHHLIEDTIKTLAPYCHHLVAEYGKKTYAADQNAGTVLLPPVRRKITADILIEDTINAHK
jgi:hypothetical protein